MRQRPATTALLCVAISALAMACVTITPAKVATTQTQPPSSTLDTPRPNPTTSPSVPAEPTGTPSVSTAKPTKPPKPPKSTDPTTEPTEPAQSTEPSHGIDPDDPACFDDAYTLEGFSWDEPFKWRYNSPSTPDGFDADEVLAIIQRGFDNMTNEVNDCGRPDNVSEVATYMGNTPSIPCSEEGDGLNVVGWGAIPGDLSEDTIAYTCPYHFTDTGEIAEADIVISPDVDWALSADDCVFQELLEPTITHEVGHALGLGHVTERGHPYLTMSTRSNGPCSNEESSLGLGDMLGLESLYGDQ